MRILGIDPGLAATGWAILEKASPPRLLQFGCVKTKKVTPFSQRLAIIFGAIGQIIKEYQPQIMAVEDLFFAKNSKTALKVAQAMGIIRLAGYQGKLQILTYTPLHIKTTIVGYGRADKRQIEFMVQKTLRRRAAIRPNHAADAVAVALTHLFQNQKLTP